MTGPRGARAAVAFGALAAAVAGTAITGCSEDRKTVFLTSTGPGSGTSASTAPIVTSLHRRDDLPGLVVTIASISSGSGTAGQWRAGDTISVTYTVNLKDGRRLPLSEVTSGAIILSGPTDNYQLVYPNKTDLLTASVENLDGSYTYTFADPLPATYAPPINDTTDFGADDGELQGQPLRSGTYTLAIQAYKAFTVDGASKRDPAVALLDVLVGDATVLSPRQVVGGDNCSRCHDRVQAHGGGRIDVRYCVLCHTAGAEDRNVATAANGTPGVSVEFQVMIHRIHNGAHLPSVLGVATAPGGSRDYTATPQPYKIVGYNNSIHDFSGFSFPVMPSAYVAYTFDQAGTTYLHARGNGPMPRDLGYVNLTPPDRLKEDRIRTGNISCEKCHGDPDGSGPLAAPAQGNVAFSQPTRRACGSCHDDIDWTKPYTANGQTMPPQNDDTGCLNCHTPQGGASLSTRESHLHPWSNPAINKGVNVTIASITSGSGTNGVHAAGDAIDITFSVKDDAGNDIPIHSLTRFQGIVTGPTTNPQLIIGNSNWFDFNWRKSSPFTGNGTISKPVVSSTATRQTIAVAFTGPNTFNVVGSASGSMATGLLVPAGGGNTGDLSYGGVTFRITDGSTDFAAGDHFFFEVVPPSSSYTITVPDTFAFERLGAATGGADNLPAANSPIYWGRQQVWEVTSVAAVASQLTLTAAAPALQHFVTVDLGATSHGIAVGDKVVIARGTAQEEYLEVARLQTKDDVTGADLGTQDRLWFKDKRPLRYAHAAGVIVAEATLSGRRELVDYTVPNGHISLIPGRFTAGNAVVMTYTSHGRFGFVNKPGEARQNVYPAAAADSEEIDLTWGDWKGLGLVSGTYTVGVWANKDFTVTPLGVITTTEADPTLSDNTTYRSISPPATSQFLYGTATKLAGPRKVIDDYEACNRCHGDLQAHGFGRRGLETCLLCHTLPGTEDGPKNNFNAWYVGATPGVTMDFRTLLHKVHMGAHLDQPSKYVVNGVFLGIPYPVSYEGAFPIWPGEAAACTVCHGEKNKAWPAPADRNHPTQQGAMPTRTWRAVCGSCHNGSQAQAHIESQTVQIWGESCATCHGAGAEYDVQVVHKRR